MVLHERNPHPHDLLHAGRGPPRRDAGRDPARLQCVAANVAATWIVRVCWDEGITSTNTAHHRVYGETRARFGLGAQLAVCARAKAVEAIKAVKAQRREEGACPQFGPRGSVRYDARTYRLTSLDRVSLNTQEGHVICRLILGARQHAMLVDPTWEVGGAALVWRAGTYYLHGTQSRDAPPQREPSSGMLGVALGIVHLATDTSSNTATTLPLAQTHGARIAIASATGV
jgi:putative transposase